MVPLSEKILFSIVFFLATGSLWAAAIKDWMGWFSNPWPPFLLLIITEVVIWIVFGKDVGKDE